MAGKQETRGQPSFEALSLLKRDLFGLVEKGLLVAPDGGRREAVRRNWQATVWILRPLAWALARREAKALVALQGLSGVPELLASGKGWLLRSWIEGQTLREQGAPGRAWFIQAHELLNRLHARGVTHNDLHKEPNLLVDQAGHPALVDFQLASRFRKRGAWYRMYVREDLRHLLKHKRRYCPEALTEEEERLLASPSWIARCWSLSGKQVYRFVTRRLLHYRDREGQGPPRG